MPQLSISDSPGVGYPGQIAQPGQPQHKDSFRAEGSGIAAGMPLCRGTNPAKQARVFSASDVPSAENFAGVLILSTSRAYSESGIADGDSLSLMRMGVIFMSLSGAFVAGQGVKITLADGTLEACSDGEAPGAGKARLPGLRIKSSGEDTEAVVDVSLGGVAQSASLQSIGPFVAPGAAGVTAASQTNLDMRHAHTVTAMAAGYVATRPGSIVGLSAQLSAAMTGSGSEMSVSVTKNGTEVALSVELTTAGAEVKASATEAAGVLSFVAGDVLGVSYTSDASLSNTPALVASLEIAS